MASRIDEKYTRLQTDLATVKAKIAELQQLEQRIIGALLVLDELQSEDSTAPEEVQNE